jgi:hypothetical protein
MRGFDRLMHAIEDALQNLDASVWDARFDLKFADDPSIEIGNHDPRVVGADIDSYKESSIAPYSEGYGLSSD